MIDPRRYRARASWGDRVVADTASAVRVDADDGPPTLWFPIADVRLDDAGSPGPSMLEGSDVPGHVAFDHDRVRVEIIDDSAGPDRPHTIATRFPTWGDAADLIEVLDVKPAGPLRYRSVARPDWRRPVVEGSQILGQAIVAAGRHTPGRRVVAAHMAFPRSVDARFPLEFELEEVSGGRTFTTLGVRVTQEQRCGGFGSVLLNQTAEDVIRHQSPPPHVPGPDESEFVDMSVSGRDLRVVDGTYTGDSSAPVGPPVIDAWVRFREVPDDQPLHAALLAQFTGHMSIAAALRPHAGLGQDQAHRTLSTAINAISISFHADVAADRWMLYRHRSTFAGDGMTHSTCEVYDEEGALVASFCVDAMVRAFAGDAHLDERTAM